eukprot:g10193.t1
MAEATKALVAPAEVLADGQTVYNLYRGVICVCRDSLARIWVDLSHMQVCVAKLDSSVIARFDVRDLVTRSVKMEEQKSPEVSPEDASVDIAEIQLEEEESETCYSLVFWAPPETSNADKDKDHGAKARRFWERQRHFAEAGKPRKRARPKDRDKDHKAVEQHGEADKNPAVDQSEFEQGTLVLQLRSPDLAQMGDIFHEDALAALDGSSKNRVNASSTASEGNAAPGTKTASKQAPSTRKLRGLVDTDGRAILHLQRNMFQYLWRFNAAAMTPDQLYSAQAVLAFNLDPKDGIAYLKEKVFRQADVEPRRVGEWIAEMSLRLSKDASHRGIP